MLRKVITSHVTRHTSHVKAILLAILSGVILALPFINGKLWICVWFAFIPLFSALNGISKIKALLLSFIAGIVFWSITIYWLVHVTLLGTIVLILYLALYLGIFGLIVSAFSFQLSALSPLIIPSIWVLLEYIRSHLFTGFPWALLAYSQYKNLPVIQIADITGAWGVSFLVMTVNVAIYVIARRHVVPTKQSKKQDCFPLTSFGVAMTIILLLIVLIYGYYKLLPTPNSQLPTRIKVSVVQGNILQELKWDPSARGYILNKYEQLTKEAAKKDTDLIIWPEAASPGLWGEDSLLFNKIFSLARDIKIPLLIGTVAKDDKEYFNSCLLINSQGEISGRYDKLHLVPFGEYIPFKKYLPFLETIVPIGDIAAGKEYTVFKISNSKYKISNKFAVLICFEDLFPELSRQFIREGAQFLVNITNDAWYKETSAPYQHLEACVFRAIENRVFLARAANTGISGFIAPSGKIISLVRGKGGKEIFVLGFDTQKIMISKKGLSFYNRFGDYFVLICLLLILYGIILTLKISNA